MRSQGQKGQHGGGWQRRPKRTHSPPQGPSRAPTHRKWRTAHAGLASASRRMANIWDVSCIPLRLRNVRFWRATMTLNKSSKSEPTVTWDNLQQAKLPVSVSQCKQEDWIWSAHGILEHSALPLPACAHATHSKVFLFKTPHTLLRENPSPTLAYDAPHPATDTSERFPWSLPRQAHQAFP